MRHFLLLIFLASSVLTLHGQPPSHDPGRMMEDGNRYWEFYTGNGISVLSASDPEFKNWQAEPSVFGNSWPTWINDYVPGFGGIFWAPDCIYMNGKYYLYYSCSTFGSDVSAIGLVTTPSLNNPTWTDQGMVIHSDGSNMAYNTIDPSIFKDDDGSVWMTFGSWFGGIAIIQLDSVTGKTTGSSTKLAGGNSQDIEASYLMKHDGYYYLFVNRGHCCQGVNSTYYVQVGRSDNVTGPYSDWRTFLQTDGRYIGPGHVGYNHGRLTYHIYDRDDDGASKLINTTLSWSNGWPVAGVVSQEPQGTVFPNGIYRISSYDSTKIVGVDNNAPVRGANVQLWQYTTDGIAGQSWTFTNTHLHNYEISPENFADLAFDVYNCVPDDGANLGLWTYWGGPCQQWNFEDRGDDYYRIRSVLSNKCLEVAGLPIAAGANLFQNSCDSSSENQLFKLKLLEGNSTGVKTPLNADKTGMELYPNPADDVLNIALSAKLSINAKLTIYNTVGQAVLTRKVSGTTESLDLSVLNSGIYMISISNDRYCKTKRFVKK